MADWLPLDASPIVVNKFLKLIGVDCEWAFIDIYSFNIDMLADVPQPVKAVILIFIPSEQEEELKRQQEQNIEVHGQNIPSGLYYMHQYVKNACGTIAVIHSIANAEDIKLSDGPLKDFIEQTKEKNPEERGKHLINFMEIVSIQNQLAKDNQSERFDSAHFVSFVNVDNVLLELDGQKKFPISHRSTTVKTFLYDAVNICQKFIERNPEECRFAVIALTPAHSD